jgi:hypothetical protein
VPWHTGRWGVTRIFTRWQAGECCGILLIPAGKRTKTRMKKIPIMTDNSDAVIWILD